MPKEIKMVVDFEVTKRTENILGKKKEIYGIKLKNGAYRDWETDRKSTRLNSSHSRASRMPSSA